MARRQENNSARGSYCLALVATMMMIMLALQLVLAPLASGHPTGMEAKSHTNYNSNNNLDSLISELLDDAASQRLKKSKNGRHLKSSLRFGRRSDPLFAPNELDELQQDLATNSNSNNNNNNYQAFPFSLD